MRLQRGADNVGPSLVSLPKSMDMRGIASQPRPFWLWYSTYASAIGSACSSPSSMGGGKEIIRCSSCVYHAPHSRTLPELSLLGAATPTRGRYRDQEPRRSQPLPCASSLFALTSFIPCSSPAPCMDFRSYISFNKRQDTQRLRHHRQDQAHPTQPHHGGV